MVFEYMDHDLTGLADRPGMRFSVPQIKVTQFIGRKDIREREVEHSAFNQHNFVLLTMLPFFPVLHEATSYWASLLSCKSSTSS